MSSEKDRLLFREKDYDLLAIKRKKQFQVSIYDPLINPPKKKKTRKAPIGFGSEKSSPDKGTNPLARLSRISKMPQKVVAQPAQQTSGEIPINAMVE